VVDPREFSSFGAVGVYPIEVQLAPADRFEVHVAMGYFRDTPWKKAVDGLRQAAPEREKRLQALDWTGPVDSAAWEKQKQRIEELRKLAPVSQTEYGPERASVLTCANAALKALAANPGDSSAVRTTVLQSRQADDLKSPLYTPALEALIGQATN
jgi:hypothetical protein